MIFIEYLRISGTENTPGGCTSEPRGRRARPTPLSAPPCLVGPTWVPSTYSSTHPLCLPSEKIIMQLKPVFLLILLPFSISLLKAPFTKLLWGIVLRYVTPPMVQLVFVLVLYLLQIFSAQVTLFLSLHVKFIWSKVVLMHDIASRHLWEELLSILLSLVHFYFESLKISEIFQRKKNVLENVPRWFFEEGSTEALDT